MLIEARTAACWALVRPGLATQSDPVILEVSSSCFYHFLKGLGIVKCPETKNDWLLYFPLALSPPGIRIKLL